MDDRSPGQDLPAMPDHPCPDRALLLSLIQRHDLTGDMLARESGISPDQVSRILGGQFRVPASLLRAAYTLTRDAAITRHLLGDSIAFPYPSPRGTPDGESRARVAALGLSLQLGSLIHDGIHRDKVTRTIEVLIPTLLQLHAEQSAAPLRPLPPIKPVQAPRKPPLRTAGRPAAAPAITLSSASA